ncbi:MAG: hypothetical protein Ct9H90mP18_02350 [Gammaproteobacteria bacterium]|nr:MAG: hypothetical protein Ct9H90mP18_02350 [Gammaproteobacteria bacterium]
MNADHFKRSAKLSVNSICNENLSLGDRIYKSIRIQSQKLKLIRILGNCSFMFPTYTFDEKPTKV